MPRMFVMLDIDQRRRVWESVEKSLEQAIYELTWAGMLWGIYGAVKLAEMRYEMLGQLDREREAASSLLSAYYTAWTNAMALPKSERNPEWTKNEAKYLVKIKELKDRLTFHLRRGDVGGIGDYMILSRVNFRLGLYEDARLIYAQILSVESSLPISPENRVLMLAEMGEIKIYLDKHEDGLATLNLALSELANISDAKTRIRVYKTVASGFLLLREDRLELLAGNYLKAAYSLAESHGLADQQIKIQVLQKKLKRSKKI